MNERAKTEGQTQVQSSTSFCVCVAYVPRINKMEFHLSIEATWNISETKITIMANSSMIKNTTSLHVWQEVTSHTPCTAVLLTSLVFVLTSPMQLQLPYP